jgi:hypothetical protein
VFWKDSKFLLQQKPTMKRCRNSNETNHDKEDDTTTTTTTTTTATCVRIPQSQATTTEDDGVRISIQAAAAAATRTSFSLKDIQVPVPPEERNNPLYIQHFQFLQSLNDTERNYFFANESTDTKMTSNASRTTADKRNNNNDDDDGSMKNYISAQRRSEIWDTQCTVVGEACVQQYSWVTPDSTGLKILHHFTPLIEIGCGSNAYWCQQLVQTYRYCRLRHSTEVWWNAILRHDEIKQQHYLYKYRCIAD